MVRLLEISLHNVKNVEHGVVRFKETPAGGSITGIYGPNGSGKTAVVNALQLLKNTCMGDELPAGASEWVMAGCDRSVVGAVFALENADAEKFYLRYEVEYAPGETSLQIASEKVWLGKTRKRLGVPVVETKYGDAHDLALAPEYVWRSVAATDRVLRDELLLSQREARRDGRSLLFSRPFLHDVAEAVRNPKRPLSRAAQTAMTKHGDLLFDGLHQLRDYASNDLFILTTDRNAVVSYQAMPLAARRDNGHYDDRILPLTQANALTREDYECLQRNVDVFNQILPTVIPGLTIELRELGSLLLDDGSVAVRSEAMSVRDGRRIPLRNESEGVLRIIGMLNYLIRVYNDADACVVIDEFDNGLFEYLLGELLHLFQQHARGQLIFTAHNLRALERLGVTDRIVLTTLDPDQRFVPFKSISHTSNGRKIYLEALATGGGTVPLYRFLQPQLMGAEFTLAGYSDDDLDIRINDAVDALLAGAGSEAR
ncbi:AAA family ATPase [Bifidobacterium cuniculi]|uniref:DNA repair ATPase n=1 Tax=Bifidobacterium cuniculi TaxID=1688 RepID=A0A087AWQ1_9BIFI|nr:AAA family ATPase [Bifidobacterium cuniculi]KFI63201.1 DNA repair ATPase [Bifidobacterium cuniculi]